MEEIRFGAVIDKVTYVQSAPDDIDIQSIHITTSDIGFSGEITNYAYTNHVIYDFDKIVKLAPPIADFEPFDVAITIRLNDGNPYVKSRLIVEVEVI